MRVFIFLVTILPNQREVLAVRRNAYISSIQVNEYNKPAYSNKHKGRPSNFSKPQQNAPEAYDVLGRPRDMIRACGRNKGSILNGTLLDLYTPKDYLFLGELGSPQQSR